MANIKLRYKITLLSIVCLMVLVSMTSFSYAYFVAVIVGNEEAKNIDINTAEVNMNFTEGTENVSLSNVYPISDEEGLTGTPYEFTLTNPNNYNVTVEILVNVLTDSTMDSSYIKVAYNNGSGQLTPALLNAKPGPNITSSFEGVKECYLLDSITLAPNGTQSFKVWFWMDESVGGVTGGEVGPSMGKDFKAKIAAVTAKSE